MIHDCTSESTDNNSGMAEVSATNCGKEEENYRQGFEVKEEKLRAESWGHRGCRGGTHIPETNSGCNETRIKSID